MLDKLGGFSFLSEYAFEIKHIKGKEKKVVDTLSRHSNLLYGSNNYESDLKNKILNTGTFDKDYQYLNERNIEN